MAELIKVSYWNYYIKLMWILCFSSFDLIIQLLYPPIDYIGFHYPIPRVKTKDSKYNIVT